MTKKIQITKTQINIQQNNIEISVKKFKFATKNGEKEIEKVILSSPSNSEGNGKDLRDLLESGNNFQIEFDESKVEQPQEEINLASSSKQAGQAGMNNMSFSSDAKAEKVEKESSSSSDDNDPIIRVNESEKILNIVYKPDIITITKLKDKEQTSNNAEESKRKGNTNNNSNSSSQESTDDNTVDDEQQTVPTEEEIKKVQEDLKNSKEPNELIDNIQKGEKMKENISDNKNNKEIEENLKKARSKLAKDDIKKYREEIVKKNLDKKLAENGLKTNDLSPNVKQSYEKLSSESETDQKEIDKIEKEVLDDTGKKSLDKIIQEAKKVLKSGDKKQIERVQKKLSSFKESKISWKKQAWNNNQEAKKSLSDLNNKYQNYTSPSPTPLWAKIGIPLVVIGALVTVIVIFSRQERK